jgi:hypothetical protein
MLPLRALALRVLIGSALVAIAGCSDPYGGRVEINGTVTLEGAPLNGQITFVPLAGQGSQSGALVVNGEYAIARKDGLKPGEYLVRLTAGDGKTPAEGEIAQPGYSNIISFDRIPKEWGLESDKKIVVKSDGPNKFDFDIPQAARPRKKR